MNFKFSSITFLAIIAGIITVSSCKDSKYPGYEQTEAGLYYKLVKHDEKGKKPEEGDVLLMDMIFKNDKDSVIFNSTKSGRREPVLLTKPTFKGGLEEGFAMLAAGDSACFIVSADSLFAKTFGRELPKQLAKGSMLTFQIKVHEITPKAQIEKLRKERMAAAAEEAAKYKEKEKIDLDKYITDNKITAKPTETGIFYVEKVKGKGAKAEKGKKVKINYIGKLINGTMFDTSIEKLAKENSIFQDGRPYGPLELTVGNGEVIPGWEEVLPMMNAGGKATFIIPSNMAYGEMNSGPIKPFSTLVFEIELIEVN